MDIELLEQEIMAKKSLLDNTDYIVIKMMENQIKGTEMVASELEEYNSIISNRDVWRSEINALETDLAKAVSNL